MKSATPRYLPASAESAPHHRIPLTNCDSTLPPLSSLPSTATPSRQPRAALIGSELQVRQLMRIGDWWRGVWRVVESEAATVLVFWGRREVRFLTRPLPSLYQPVPAIIINPISRSLPQHFTPSHLIAFSSTKRLPLLSQDIQEWLSAGVYSGVHFCSII